MNPEDLLAARVLREMKRSKRPTVRILFDGYNALGVHVYVGVVGNDNKVIFLERVASPESA